MSTNSLPQHQLLYLALLTTAAISGTALAATEDTFWVNIQVASLPAQIELCRNLGPDAVTELGIDANGEYEWDVGIDIDANAGTGTVFGTNGSDIALTIYATNPGDLLYFQHCNGPLYIPTQTALRAAIANNRPGTPGFSEWNSVPVSVDIDRGMISVQLDRNRPELAELSPQSLLNVSAWCIYRGPCIDTSAAGCHGQRYATDFAPPLAFGSTLPSATTDPHGDVSACQPYGDWCNGLDLVGVSVTNESPVSSAAIATPTTVIGPAFTGSWYDPNQSGHGLAIEVLPNNGFLAYWFTYAPDGSQQAWFLGTGSYAGNTATIAQIDQPSGGRWIPNFNPETVADHAWGALTFTFSDCNHGRVDFNSTLPDYGRGYMDLTRLTMPAGLSCP